MQFTNANAKPIDNRFIHSSLGIRYLTILVKDMDAAVARAKKAGVEPMAKGPIALPEGLSAGVYLACVRDPDGNIIELLGPRGGT
jgi:predicted enzyme related to lactoylglutathione lyase